MEDNNLFERIRQKITEEQLPFEEADWRDMQSRLDKGEQRKIFPFLPLNPKNALGMTAAAAALIIGLFFFTRRGTETTPAPTVAKHAAPERRVDHPAEPVAAVPDSSPALAREGGADKPAAQGSMVKRKKVYPQQADNTTGNTPEAEAPVAAVIPVAAADTVPGRTATREKKPVQKLVYDEPDVPDTRNNRFYLTAGGGVIGIDQSFGYTLSAAIVKSLSRRVSIQAGLAYIYDTRKAEINELTVNSRLVTGVGGSFTQFDAEVTQTSIDLAQNYTQADVSLNFSVSAKSDLAAGIDLQRLMTSREELDAVNQSLAGGKEIPLWNSGVKLRYQHTIVRNLALGLAYRFDVSSTLGNKSPHHFTQAFIVYRFRR